MKTSSVEHYIQYLQSFPRFGAREYLGLARIEALLAELGHPERRLKGWQIAGTNGKGSTTAMVESVLCHAGYRVGSFYSPHLVSYTERLRVDGKAISQREFIRLIRRIRPAVLRVEERLGDRPTWFEVITAAAALWFAERRVEWCVFEVGLGGRLDATTALPLRYKIITSIGKDHTQILGSTIRQIAAEKAACVQKGSLVVTGATGEALKVIKRRCRRVGARLLPSSQVTLDHMELDKTSYRLTRQNQTWVATLRLVGGRQPENAGLAFDSVSAALKLPPELILAGLSRATEAARFQIVSRRPVVILDGAHNPQATRELVNTMQRIRDTKPELRRLVIVFAAKENKDYATMLATLAKLSRAVYFPRLDLPHMVEVKELKAAYPRGVISADLKTALKQATLKAGLGGVVLITGSFYLAGQVLAEKHAHHD